MLHLNPIIFVACRGLAVAAACVSVTWALSDGRFRDSEGYYCGAICLPIAAAVGLVVWAAAARTSWNRFAAWLGIALVGQAVALQLIHAGPTVHYQHYALAAEYWKAANIWLLVLLGCQTILVVVAYARRRSAVREAISRSVGVWRFAAILLLVCCVGAPVSRHVPDYLIELPFAAFVQLLNLATMILLVAALPTDRKAQSASKLNRWFGPADASGATDDIGIGGFAVAGAIWVTAAAAILNAVSYERHPHIHDEVIYLQQARMLASGSLTVPAPPTKAPFDIYLMAFDGDRWYGTPPAGWPAVLSLGVAAGVPSLVNPVLAGLNTIMVAFLVAQLYDRRTARLVVALLCVSPWYVFMAMNYMTHTLSLTCVLAAALALMKSRQTRRASWALAAGVSLGYLSLIRPLEALIMAVLLGLWAIGIGGRRLTVPSVAAFVIGTGAIGAMVLPYNHHLTGNATTFPIMQYNDARYGPGSNALGFGADRGMGWALDPWPGHGPLDAVVNTNLNLFSLNAELLGWSVGSLLFVATMLVWGKWSGPDRLMAAVIAGIIGIHVFYWYSGGPDFGARYWYLLIVPCIVLTVRGIHTAAEKLPVAGRGLSESRRQVMIGVVCMSCMTLVNYFPWRAIDKYHHYLQMRPDIPQIASRHRMGRSLVLIRGDAHPDYASAAAYNPLNFSADAPIYAWGQDPQASSDAVDAYPDRPIWIVDGPSLTGRGFEVVAGPLTPAQLAIVAP